MPLRFALSLICLLFLLGSCSNPNAPVRYEATKKGPIILPEAASSWYLIKHDSITFRAKNVQLNVGQLNVSMPDRNTVTDINLLKGLKPSSLRWQCEMLCQNQTDKSVSLSTPNLYISVNDSLQLLLTDLDQDTYNFLMLQQEAYGNRILTALQSNKLHTSYVTQKRISQRKIRYASAFEAANMIPVITQGDNDSNNVVSKRQGIYLSGYTNDTTHLLNWLIMDVSKKPCSATMHVGLIDKHKHWLDRDSIVLDPNNALFWLVNWCTHYEYIELWDAFHAGEPVPDFLPSNAGIAVKTSILTPGWVSDDMEVFSQEEFIIIRSEELGQTIPVGQPVLALIGQMM